MPKHDVSPPKLLRTYHISKNVSTNNLKTVNTLSNKKNRVEYNVISKYIPQTKDRVRENINTSDDEIAELNKQCTFKQSVMNSITNIEVNTVIDYKPRNTTELVLSEGEIVKGKVEIAIYSQVKDLDLIAFMKLIKHMNIEIVEYNIGMLVYLM
ncbi:hypothetical protein AX774_g354 [Zancudomyces culisetae]|uniref:Uncharacterized protein n=1 Tax=Zancudomyces culisetae TaxID=1213189 RepID=A0A1R1PYN4_ZANCU|nr:hypothetical protein AX774_g354 [Zancudomyces culisetae]|eukprot:OMH86076.1 hypothetical protein AX774_g354 [Zancudomyces culisetae]